MMVAAYRARASNSQPALCTDPWAAALAGSEGRDLAATFDANWSHMELWIAVRTAFLDRHIELFTEDHDIVQVVVLGAGLDTRAARLRRDGIKFFEVDHASTQEEKRRRLGEIDDYPVDAATYASCDFEREDFLDRLVVSGFDAKAPAVIVWEGVVPYLTEPAVRATSRRVASGCHPRTILMFDYLRKRMVSGANLRDEDKEALDLVTGVGEPVTFGTDDPLPLLYEEGFRHVRTVTFDQACLSLTGTYERERAFRFQHMAVASATAPTVP
jgi:methyltransferase (TIGR00027 family)